MFSPYSGNERTLVLRALQDDMQEIGRTHGLPFLIEKISIRTKQFTPFFTISKSGEPKPIEGYAPFAQGFCILADGNVVSLNHPIVSQIKTGDQESGAGGKASPEMQTFMDKTLADLKGASNRYNLNFEGAIPIFDLSKVEIIQQRQVSPQIGIFKFHIRPTSNLTVAIGKDCAKKCRELSIVIAGQRIDGVKAGSNVTRSVFRGRNEVIWKCGDEEHRALPIVRHDQTFGIKCSDQGFHGRTAIDFLGNEVDVRASVQLHEKKAEHLNQSFESLVSSVQLPPEDQIRGGLKNTGGDIGTEKESSDRPRPFISVIRDRRGTEVGRFSQIDGKVLGLFGEPYAKFMKLTDDLVSYAEFRDIVNGEFVRKTALNWLLQKHADETDSKTFVDTFIEQVDQSIKEYEIALPISFLDIEDSINIGKVRFVKVNAKYFNETTSGNNAETEPPDVSEWLSHLSSKYSRTVFAITTVKAERDYAIEVAKDRVEKALTILRFYSPTVFYPEIPLVFGPEGKAHPLATTVLVKTDGNVQDTLESLDWSGDPTLHISTDERRNMEDLGMRRASEILSEHFSTKLEQLCLSAISIYAHALRSTSLHDRVVFTLTAIETLLSGGTNEPIQQAISLRLGFLCGSTSKQRREVMANLRKAYSYRSGYLHHGKMETDLEVVRKLQTDVWTAINAVMQLSELFVEQEEVLDLIERNVLL